MNGLQVCWDIRYGQAPTQHYRKLTTLFFFSVKITYVANVFSNKAVWKYESMPRKSRHYICTKFCTVLQASDNALFLFGKNYACLIFSCWLLKYHNGWNHGKGNVMLSKVILYHVQHHLRAEYNKSNVNFVNWDMDQVIWNKMKHHNYMGTTTLLPREGS
jgi:hypothetical protein